MKRKIFLAHTIKQFEEFLETPNLDIISIDVKAVEQSYSFQDGFMGIIFYWDKTV